MEGTVGLSGRAAATAASMEPILEFYFRSRYGGRRGDPGICDLTFGNPHEFPLPGLVAAIRERAIPHDKDWFAYKMSEAEPQAFLADCVGRELGLAFEPADIALTSGAFGAIAAAFRLLLDPGDEAIFSVPPWFCYAPMLLAADAVPRQVALTPGRIRSRPRGDRGRDRTTHAAGDRQHATQSDRPDLRSRRADGAGRAA